MPSSPELTAPRWEPDELGAAALTARPGPPLGVPARSELFEVSPEVGVPAALLDAARRRAEAAGYAAGWSRGVSAARLTVETDAAELRRTTDRDALEARAAVQRAVDALAGASAALLAQNAPAIAAIEELLVSSAVDIAEAVIGAAVRDDPQRGATALARALALVPEVADVRVALNPTDRRTLETSGAVLPPHVRLVDDPALAPGDAVAVSGASTVDARISGGLERVRAVLAR